MTIPIRPGAAGAAALALALVAGAATAESDPCREWVVEHDHWKKEVVGRYLSPVPQEDLDKAVFELLQREAYLTSCDESVRAGRAERVAWRMLDRLPDEYAAAVVESVLDSAGYDLALDELRGGRPAAAPRATRGRSLARSGAR